MKTSKKLLTVVSFVVFLLLATYFLWQINKKMTTQFSGDIVNQVYHSSSSQSEVLIEYKNTQYGFNFLLPATWKGYSAVIENWTSNPIDGQGNQAVEGPKIIIRHPLWTIEKPRQDIPIMIFTPDQWSLIQQEKLSIGAAPIGPSELGHNTSYVFALPARYNYAFPVGFEEVEKILENKPLSAF